MKRNIPWIVLLIGIGAALLPVGRRVHLRALDLRAAAALNRGDYASAIGLLERMERIVPPDSGQVELLRERIRHCRDQVDATPALVSRGQRQLHSPPGRNEVRTLEIRQLGNFDPAGGIPDDVLRLTGLRLRTRGYMMPMDRADHITRLTLVPSLSDCCYGLPPQLNHMIIVDAAPGLDFDYSPDEIIVEGTLLVEPRCEQGQLTELFRLASAHRHR